MLGRAKDPVCNMNVDEKTCKTHIRKMETKYILALLHANNNWNKILQNMAINITKTK